MLLTRATSQRTEGFLDAASTVEKGTNKGKRKLRALDAVVEDEAASSVDAASVHRPGLLIACMFPCPQLTCRYVNLHYKFLSSNILSADRASGWKAGMSRMSVVAGIFPEWSASTRGILTLDHSPPKITSCQHARRCQLARR